MLARLVEFLKPKPKETFTPVGTCQFHYVDSSGNKTETITLAFLLGNLGGRDIKLYYKERPYGNDPTTHQYYHSVAIPWMTKTSIFATEDRDTLLAIVDQVCGLPPRKPKVKQEQVPELVEKEDKTIKTDFNEIDSLDEFLETKPFGV